MGHHVTMQHLYVSKGRKVNLMHLELHPDKICKCPDLCFVSPIFSIFKHDLRIKNHPLFHLQVHTHFSIFVVPENHLSSILQQRTSVFSWGKEKNQSKHAYIFKLSTANLESSTVICRILYRVKNSSLRSSKYYVIFKQSVNIF